MPAIESLSPSGVLTTALKLAGQFQFKNQYIITMPYIPMIGSGLEVSFLTRNTILPGFKRESTLVTNSVGKRFTIPSPLAEFTHEWEVNLILLEFDQIYRKLYVWNRLLEYIKLELLKTSAQVLLVSSGLTKIPTKVANISGIYVKNFPEIGDLNYDNNIDYYVGKFLFAFDRIDYF
jgi:hypothetical protein